MHIVKSDKYLAELSVILRFIALNSPERARIFKQELTNKVMEVDHFPYKYRASIHFESQEIRDMIFKGYVIPYYIDKLNDEIILIGIAKYKEGV